ncbi:MAG: hypothetical protein WCO06_07020 [Candidatus Roizmanbacteria bacterium]
MKQAFIQSSQIYRQPSFLKGIARIFDLFGVLDRSQTQCEEQMVDYTASKRDWNIIGNDISRALNRYGANKR